MGKEWRGERDWEESKERKLQPGRKINKQKISMNEWINFLKKKTEKKESCFLNHPLVKVNLNVKIFPTSENTLS